MSEPKKTVLISGASIAGPATAYWLNRYGFSTTIVERAPELRLGGQNVDVRGVGREVIKKMGMESAVLEHNTGEVGIKLVDAQEYEWTRFAASANGPTAELEILRGDLSQLLVDATEKETEYIYGDSIKTLEDKDDGKVMVTFQRGEAREFDFVIVADGLNSRTRKLVVGDEAVFKPLNLYIAYFTVPRTETDTGWAKWYTFAKKRVMFIRPDNHGTTRVSLGWLQEPCGYEKLDKQGFVDLLRQRFTGAAKEVNRVLDDLDTTEDLYYEAVGQMKTPRWHSGRTVLVGDAAYCASPLSGMGTSLALAGAYTLAGELAKNRDQPEEAYEAYRRVMRPIVDKAQKLPPGVPGLVYVESEWGVTVLNTITKVLVFFATLPYVIPLLERIFMPSADKHLPDYSKYLV